MKPSSECWRARPDRTDKDGSWEVVCTIRGKDILLAYGLTERLAHLIAATEEMYDALTTIDASWRVDFPEGPEGDYHPFKLAEEHRNFWRKAVYALAVANGVARMEIAGEDSGASNNTAE